MERTEEKITAFGEIEAIYDAAVAGAEAVVTAHQQALARAVVARAFGYMAPPPDMTTAEWADEYRYIAPGTSQHPGKWKTSRRPFLKGIMDAFDDPRIETVTIKKASRMGITECINNKIGRHIHLDPCAMMYAQQTLGEAKKYNAKLLMPFLRATPILHDVLPPEKSRQSGSTIFEKSFPGGSLTLVGANVATGFRMVYIVIGFGDDLDGWEWVVGKEGDPVENFIGRTAGVWNRKIILASKPTVKHYSRIDLSYEQSDKRLYHMPCPHCDHGLVFRWVVDKDADFGVKWDGDDPYSAYYLCEQCHGVVRDFDKPGMLAHGDWIPTAVSPRHAGFGGLSQLYHPDISFAEMVKDFLKCKDNPEQLQVFVNDRIGECWEDKGEAMSETSLYDRREDYGLPVSINGKNYDLLPEGVCMLTVAEDVGENHIACQVEGWGRGSENWVIDYALFEGDTLLPEVWDALREYRKRTWWHPSGIQMMPSIEVIDSGYRGEMVANYVKEQKKAGVNCIAVKGDERTRFGEIISGSLPSKKNKYKVHIYIVNDDKAKISVLGRLKVFRPGPAYVHFPKAEWCDVDYFNQLLSEKKVRVRQGGLLVSKWIRKPGVRNEPLDVKKYNLAGLIWLQKHRKFDLDKAADIMLARMEEYKRRQMEEGNLDPKQYFKERVEKMMEKQESVKKHPAMPRKNWVKGWRP